MSRWGVKDTLLKLDELGGRLALRHTPRRCEAFGLALHSLYEQVPDPEGCGFDVQQSVTVAYLRELISALLEAGYLFVRPSQVAGPMAAGRYVVLTFDDGYANNLRVLPLLGELGVPAALFVTPGPVASGRAFWWDAVHRSCRRRGLGPRETLAAQEAIKRLAPQAALTELAALCTEADQTPVGYEDRPLTPAELRGMAGHPMIEIGNHGYHHCPLTALSVRELNAELRQAQEGLRELTGLTPTAISYPNGDHDDVVHQVCIRAGLTVGFTLTPEATRLSGHRGAGAAPMGIGRFLPDGTVPVARQCARFASPVSLYREISRAKRAGGTRLRTAPNRWR